MPFCYSSIYGLSHYVLFSVSTSVPFDTHLSEGCISSLQGPLLLPHLSGQPVGEPQDVRCDFVHRRHSLDDPWYPHSLDAQCPFLTLPYLAKKRAHYILIVKSPALSTVLGTEWKSGEYAVSKWWFPSQSVTLKNPPPNMFSTCHKFPIPLPSPSGLTPKSLLVLYSIYETMKFTYAKQLRIISPQLCICTLQLL